MLKKFRIYFKREIYALQNENRTNNFRICTSRIIFINPYRFVRNFLQTLNSKRLTLNV